MPHRVPKTEAELDALLSIPRPATTAALARAPGDIVVLGAGGKMGPTLAQMARRAAGDNRRVIAASRFTSPEAEESLRDAGVETVHCDFLDRSALARLPDAPNVVFMAGQKFGTTDSPERTWMMNVVVPANCAARYPDARIVVFSTGNVYPLVPVASGGARETDTTGPIGEYASSCLGRERVFEHYARSYGTRVAIVRLNYAIDLRYGVLVDLAMRILREQPISLRMGYVNVIWQRDANAAALELLPHASSPPLTVNVTGAQVLPVREIARLLGQRLGKAPLFTDTEEPDALLSNTARMTEYVGEPEMPLATMLDWIAAWVKTGGKLLGKDTKYEVRTGEF